MGTWVRTLLITGDPDEVAPIAEQHRAHLRELNAQGRLRAAGALAPEAGFLEIFEAVERHEAEAIARSSPLIEAGLGTWMLREWLEFDPGAGESGA